MARPSNRKRRSTSSSPVEGKEDGAASKRSKAKSKVNENEKENSQSSKRKPVDEPDDEPEHEESPSSPSDNEATEEEAVDAPKEEELDLPSSDEKEPAEEEDYQEEEKSEDEELEAEEEDDEETFADTSATAARGRKSSSSSSSSSSNNVTGQKSTEAGIIKEIYCENFMCHRKLRVQLNRNVNFIHGQNGSGKSAILAAIQICLGAGARRTHRARNLKDLVRKDSAASSMPGCAKIRVTLLNQGSDGYKHELYGDSITVERTIALRGGYNGYKLLNHEGVEQSRSKRDLDEMLDTLNILVENPVAVLDQEEAKKFLMGKAEDKYNFFMQATELDRVDRTYATTMDTLIELTDTNFRIKEGLSVSMDHVENLRKKYAEHQEMGKLETKLQKFNTECGWANYNELDEKYQEQLQQKQLFEEKARKKQEELTQAEESIGNPEQDQSKKDRVNELVKEADELLRTRQELKDELEELKGPYKDSERKLAKLKKQQTSAAKQLKAAKSRLQEQRDQIFAKAGSAESDEARRTALLNDTEEKLAAAREKVDELKQAQSQHLRSWEEIEPHVQDARDKVGRLGSQVQGIKGTLQNLQSSSGNALAILGPRVAAVANLISKAQRAKKFRGEVVGPIGSFIKIAHGKADFASVAEHALGHNVLDRFIVTNDFDNRILRDIRSKAGCKQDCGVFQIHPASRFNIADAPSADGIETVASVLSIENDNVFNCLVDNCRMEKKAIALDRRLGESKLLTQNAGGGSAIRGGNITEVYCLPKGDHFTVKSGSLAVFSNERNLRQTIGVDKTAAIAEAQRDLERIKVELSLKQQEEAKLNHEHTEHQRNWNRSKKAVQQNDAAINDLSEQIDRIREEIESSTNVTVDTSEYEEDVAQAEEAVESLKATEQTVVAEKEAHLPRIKEVKGRLEECNSREARVQEDLVNAEEVLTQLLQTQTQLTQQVEKKKQKLQKYKDLIAVHDEAIGEQSEARDNALQRARKLHFRFVQRTKANASEESTGMPQEIRKDATAEELEAIEPQAAKKGTDFYMARIKQIKEKIEKERARRNVSNDSDPAAAYERYSKAKSDLEVKSNQVSETDAKISELQADITKRQKRWQQFRKHLSQSTGLKFDEMLSMNKYSGELKFSHNEKTLDLAVQKNSSDSKSETKDVKALSGGERSYTTMCLLLALGETLETPFRILDEFDVFLDAEVRKLTIQSLIHVAKRMSHRQFIFITPQDLSSIQPDPQLKILKLNAPDRYGDNAGGPSQQTINFASSQ